MPTYVFRFDSCGEQFGKVMPVGERTKGRAQRCPRCKKKSIERVCASLYAKTSRKG
jgi:putative FmdB family regulatory protein